MKKAEIKVSRKPGKISIDNFDEIREYVLTQTKPFTDFNYAENPAKASSDKKILLKLKSELENSLKEAMSVYSLPLEEVKFSLMQLLTLVNTPLAAIDESISAHKAQKHKRVLASISAFFYENAKMLGSHAEAVFDSPAFVENKWTDAPALTMGTKNAIIDKINRAAIDISSIETTSQSLAPVLLAKYFEALSMEEVISFKEAIVKAANGRLPGIVRTVDNAHGQGDIVLHCDEDSFLRTLDQLKLMNIDFYVKSSSYTTVLHEIKEPDFDSFVALDIETTGSFGVSNGDSPSEIMEIGAVKVENGIVTDRFSMLANPGRSITPHVVKLTHITDEMVADKPSVNDVVKKFVDFAGDFILVGHSIKSSDLPFICKACARNGIEFKNRYFDTCDYAARLKDKYGWQKIRLEYLSELFGINQREAHRAYCDAEANVGVYFALKALKSENI